MKPLIMLADSHTPFHPGELAAILGTPHPTEFHRTTEEQLASILEEPEVQHLRQLSPEDINRMAAIDLENRQEGRTMRPFRTNPHGD